MRLVAYYRVSSSVQLDGYGIELQRADCRRWARANDHRIVAEFHDSISGASDSIDRDGFTAALAALKVNRSTTRQRGGRAADGLMIGRLDRLARALTVQEAALAVVWREGASVFAADQGEVKRDDPDDPMRTAMRQVQGVFAELDRRTTVKRLRDGINAKRAEGRHATGVYPFGYHGERVGRQLDAAPQEVEQAAVTRILQLRSEGDSYRVIAARLDGEGFAPRYAERWSAMAVRNTWEREHGRSPTHALAAALEPGSTEGRALAKDAIGVTDEVQQMVVGKPDAADAEVGCDGDQLLPDVVGEPQSARLPAVPVGVAVAGGHDLSVGGGGLPPNQPMA